VGYQPRGREYCGVAAGPDSARLNDPAQLSLDLHRPHQRSETRADLADLIGVNLIREPTGCCPATKPIVAVVVDGWERWREGHQAERRLWALGPRPAYPRIPEHAASRTCIHRRPSAPLDAQPGFARPARRSSPAPAPPLTDLSLNPGRPRHSDAAGPAIGHESAPGSLPRLLIRQTLSRAPRLGVADSTSGCWSRNLIRRSTPGLEAELAVPGAAVGGRNRRGPRSCSAMTGGEAREALEDFLPAWSQLRAVAACSATQRPTTAAISAKVRQPGGFPGNPPGSSRRDDIDLVRGQSPWGCSRRMCVRATRVLGFPLNWCARCTRAKAIISASNCATGRDAIHRVFHGVRFARVFTVPRRGNRH